MTTTSGRLQNDDGGSSWEESSGWGECVHGCGMISMSPSDSKTSLRYLDGASPGLDLPLRWSRQRLYKSTELGTLDRLDPRKYEGLPEKPWDALP